MNNDELLASHELIKDSGSQQQSEALSAELEALQPADLEKISDYMGTGVAAGSDWRDYLYALSDQEWYKVNEAFRSAMGRDLNLG